MPARLQPVAGGQPGLPRADDQRVHLLARAAGVDRSGAVPSSTPASSAARASGCSTGGSSLQRSITCSGQPCRALAASATASGVARSWRPQIKVVGAVIRASSAAGMALAPRRHQRDTAALTAGVRARSTL